MSGPPYKVLFVFFLVFSLSIMGYWAKREIEAPEREAWKAYDLEQGETYHINGLDLTINTSIPEYPKTMNVYKLKGFKLTEKTARQRIEEEFPGYLTQDFSMYSDEFIYQFNKGNSQDNETSFDVTINGGIRYWNLNSDWINLNGTNGTDLLLLAYDIMESHGVDTEHMAIARSTSSMIQENSTRFWFYFYQIIDGRKSTGWTYVGLLSNGSMYAYGENLLITTRIAAQSMIHDPGAVFGQINRYKEPLGFVLHTFSETEIMNISLEYYQPTDRGLITGTILRPAWAFELCTMGCSCSYDENQNCYDHITYQFDAETLRQVSY
jgi:hypothetical protein